MCDPVLQFGEKPQANYLERISAYAVVFNDRKELLVLQVKGVYHLPGGGLDDGEDPQVAVVREAMEEAGCVITDLEYLGKANQFFLKSRLGPLNKLATFYKAKLVSIDDSKSIEVDHKVCWITVDEFLKSEAGEFQKWAVQRTVQLF